MGQCPTWWSTCRSEPCKNGCADRAAVWVAFCLLMGYNFGCMIASDTLFDSKGWVFGVKLSDEDIADFEVLRDVAMATIFWLSIYGCTLAPPGEYDWTVHMRRGGDVPYVKLLWPFVIIKTIWLYCVECPQYSIQLEVLGYLCDCWTFVQCFL